MQMTPLSHTFNITPTKRKLEQNSVVEVEYIQESDPFYIRPESITFTYQISWLDPNRSLFQVYFDTPELVSSDYYHKDLIIIHFNDTEWF